MSLFKRAGRRGLSVLLALVMLLPIASAANLLASAADTITVYIDFEGYNLGQGFYIKPTALTLPEGSTAADALTELFEQKGVEAQYHSEWGYLTAVKGFDTGTVNIPSYITGAPGFALDSETNNDDWLGEYDYTSQSGWMYTLNHASGGGIAYDILSDGDVIRFQFSLWGWGNDLGVEDEWGYAAPFYVHADKTALIRLLFTPGAGAAEKRAALAVIINPRATDDEIARAGEGLQRNFLQRWEAKLPGFLSWIASLPDWLEWAAMVIFFGWVWWLF